MEAAPFDRVWRRGRTSMTTRVARLRSKSWQIGQCAASMPPILPDLPARSPCPSPPPGYPDACAQRSACWVAARSRYQVRTSTRQRTRASRVAYSLHSARASESVGGNSELPS